MLLKLVVVLGILAVTDGRYSLSKRTSPESPTEAAMNYIVRQYRYTLLKILAAKRTELLPKIKTLKEEAPACKAKIATKSEQCKTCAKDECKPSFGEIIEAYLKIGGDYMKYPFVEFANLQIWIDIGDYFNSKGDDFLNWSGWGDANDFFDNIFNPLYSWSGWEKIGDTFGSIGDIDFGDIEDLFGDLGDWGLDILGDIGDWGKDLGDDLFGGLFRRKKRSVGSLKQRERELWLSLYRAVSNKLDRRDIDPDVKKCMENCDECTPFLNTETLLASICGDEFANLNDTVNRTASAIEVIYKRVMDSDNLILTKIAYNPAVKSESSDPKEYGYTEVDLTVKSADGYITYRATNPYNPSSLKYAAASAARFALEYWERYYQNPF